MAQTYILSEQGIRIELCAPDRRRIVHLIKILDQIIKIIQLFPCKCHCFDVCHSGSCLTVCCTCLCNLCLLIFCCICLCRLLSGVLRHTWLCRLPSGVLCCTCIRRLDAQTPLETLRAAATAELANDSTPDALREKLRSVLNGLEKEGTCQKPKSEKEAF